MRRYRRNGNTVAKNIEKFPRPTSSLATYIPAYIWECINSLVTRDFSPVRKKESIRERRAKSISLDSRKIWSGANSYVYVRRSRGREGAVRLRQECRRRANGVGGAVGGHGGESVRPQRAFRKLPLTRGLIRSSE